MISPPPSELLASGLLQASWTGHHLFVWSRTGPVESALAELPGLPAGKRASHPVSLRKNRTSWTTVDGVNLELGDVLPLLGGLANDAPVSDALRAFSFATKLALELAVRKRVVPTVTDGIARWIAVLSVPEDRARFDAVAESLPYVARTTPSDSVKTPPLSAAVTLRSFLDAAVDRLYRQGAYAGPARGWALDFAQALRGDDPKFAVREARSQATPARIAAWAGRAEAPVPRVGLRLDLPERDGKAERFPLRVVLHAVGDPRTSVPAAEAWSAGRSLRIGDQDLAHPAESAIRGLARAARLYPPLSKCLAGDRPQDLELDAAQAWAFLDTGRAALEAAGFAVVLPDAFEHAGRQRIRARIRLGLGTARRLDLSDLLSFRWEVLVGDQALSGAEFGSLTGQNRPIVKWNGDWVFLDPVELARLPQDLSAIGKMKAPEALRALLTGEHNGVPVVADERLSALLDALRDPPELPLPDGLTATLRPYQARGFAWLAALGTLGLGALLADDMGLGKTVQLIAYLLTRRDTRAKPAASLVVCPTSVLGNWQREIARFAPELSVLRWHGVDREGAALDKADVVLTTYGLLVRDIETLSAYRWDVVALDEAQSIKNPDSRRARAARQLDAQHRVALTGTPVENRLDELWSVMEFLVPSLLGPRATFQRQVAVPVERFGDPEAAARLRQTVGPFLLRRTKSDPTVVDDLPDKLERREYCVLTEEQRALYQEVASAALAEITGAADLERRGRVLAMLTALKQICNHPYHYLRRFSEEADPVLPGRSGKLDRISEVIEQIASCNERVVLFTQYREMGELLQVHLESILGEPIPFLHGGTPATGRDEMVKRFQAEDDFAPTAMIISLKAGGTGLNLTSATHVIHYDRWWNPAIEDQATDRAHRIGQHRTVVVHKIVCEGTLEERIDALLDEKRELFDAVVGTGERWVTELDDDALRKLVLLGPSGPTEVA